MNGKEISYLVNEFVRSKQVAHLRRNVTLPSLEQVDQFVRNPNYLSPNQGYWKKVKEWISLTGMVAHFEAEYAGDYYVSAKAIAPAVTDFIKAKITLVDNTINPDSVKFVSGKGIVYTATVTKSAPDTTYEISIMGGPEKDAQEIYAVYQQAGKKTLNLGKLLVASYPRRDYKVTFVHVSGTIPDFNRIKDSINNYYNRINIYPNINSKQNALEGVWDLNNDGLDVKGSGFFSSLTYEMKLLNKAYLNKNEVADDEIVIFFLNNASDTTVFGDMPRGQRFGYIFTNLNDNVEKIVAHEIGHGRFSLKHIFEYGFPTNNGLTNVMDYPCGNNFTKHQWDLLNDPAIVIALFNKDEQNLYAEEPADIKDATDTRYQFSISDADNTNTGVAPEFYVFYTPDGIGYKIEKTKISEPVIDQYGVLTHFKIIATNKTYSAYKSRKTKIFTRYRDDACCLPFKASNNTFPTDKVTDCSINMTSAGFIPLPDNAKLDNVKAIEQFWRAHKNQLINDNPALRAEIQALVVKLPSLAIVFVDKILSNSDFDLIALRNLLQKKIDAFSIKSSELDTKIASYFNVLKEKIPLLSYQDLKIPLSDIQNVSAALNEEIYKNRLDDARCQITKFFEDNCSISLINHPDYETGEKSRTGASILQSLTIEQRKQILNIFYQSPTLTSTSWGASGSGCLLANFGEEIVVAMLRYCSSIPDKLAILGMFKSNPDMLTSFYNKIDNSVGNGTFGGSDNFDALVKELLKLSILNFTANDLSANNNNPTIQWNPQKDWYKFTFFDHVKFNEQGNIILQKYNFDLLKGIGNSILPLGFLVESPSVSVIESAPIDPWAPMNLVLTAPDFDIYADGSQDLTDYPKTLILPAISVAQLVNKVSNKQIKIGVDVGVTVLSFGQLAAAEGALQFIWRSAQVLIPLADIYLGTTEGKNAIYGLYKKIEYPNKEILNEAEKNNVSTKVAEFSKNWSSLTALINIGAMGEGVFNLYKNVKGSVYRLNQVADLTADELKALNTLKGATEDIEQGMSTGLKSKLPTIIEITKSWIKAFKSSSAGVWFNNLANRSVLKINEVGNKLECIYRSKRYANQEFKIAEVIEENGTFRVIPVEGNIPGNYSKYSIEEVTDANIYNNADGAAIVCEGGACGSTAGGCFTAGTLVDTKNGLVEIENLQVGQFVKTYDSLNSKTLFSKVTNKAQRAMGLLRKIVLGRDTLTATPNHLFYTRNGWQQATRLAKGSLVFLCSLQWQPIDTVIITDKAENVYNIEVENTHNFFVGKNKILVHNGIPCSGQQASAIGTKDANLLTQTEIESAYFKFSEEDFPDLIPGSIAHKAQRWEQYKLRKAEEGEQALTYNNWSNVYTSNMTKALRSTTQELEVQKMLGWGKKGAPNVPLPNNQRRICDIIDNERRRAVEVKAYETGYVSNSKDIGKEILADSYLVNDLGWDIEWIFKGCTPSGPLKILLESKNIRVTEIP